MRGIMTVQPMVWAGDRLRLIDQRVLPHEERWIECRTAEGVARAIHEMAVRGAPAIGIAAAYGLVLAGADAKAYDAAERGCTLRMRSSAQRRFTAVGREAARARSAASYAAPRWAASTRPNAAAMPIAGAPRTAMSRIAPATSSALRQSM